MKYAVPFLLLFAGCHLDDKFKGSPDMSVTQDMGTTPDLASPADLAPLPAYDFAVQQNGDMTLPFCSTNPVSTTCSHFDAYKCVKNPCTPSGCPSVHENDIQRHLSSRSHMLTGRPGLWRLLGRHLRRNQLCLPDHVLLHAG